MPERLISQRHLLWLALGTAMMAAAMAVLLLLQFTQQQAIRKSADLRSDSITALAFQLEREFLRLRHVLEVNAKTTGPIDEQTLLLRSDIFASRFQLMHDTPSASAVQERIEYTRIMPRLQLLIAHIDAVLLPPAKPTRKALEQLVGELNSIGPDVQELTMVATRHTARLLEEQESTMLEQSNQIMALILGQLVFLLIAAVALAVRQRRQEKERAALELLTQNLRAANLAAEAANRGKSQFLANMSHELRTPFNGVLGMLTMLERSTLSSSQQEFVLTARNSADHLLTLLNDILDVSAMETGKMSIHPVLVELDPLLTDVERLMRPLAEQKGLTFDIARASNLPPWVSADGTRLKQIVLNLVTNAIKFSDAGRVSLTIDRYAATQGIQTSGIYPLQITVADQGIGMDASTLDRLFERFSQGDASTSRRFGGTGLGLEISRNLARRMGGDISVTSEPGKGSTFTVQLPLVMADAPESRLQVAHEVVAVTRPADVQGLRILVADDQAVNRKYMGALLQDMGHTTAFAENGEQAFDAATNGGYDLVLMDLHMPLMDGFEATRRIRSHPGSSLLPVIALTADVFAETRHKAAEAGMTAFISKPVNAGVLQATMTDLFGVRGAPAQPGTRTESEPPSAMNAQAQTGVPVTAPRKPRRRFRPGDLETHMDMKMVGEVCIGVSAKGYRSLLGSFFQDESGAMDALLLAMRNTGSPELSSTAHAFKGAAANLGFHRLAAMALSLEKAQPGSDTGLPSPDELLEAWGMAHALCLRMGLTDIEALQERHICAPDESGG